VTIAGRPVITTGMMAALPTCCAPRPVTIPITPTLTFVSRDRVSGRSGCNGYSAPLSIVGNRIRIALRLGIFISCSTMEITDQEQRFLAALAAAERLAFVGPFLVLHPSGQGAPIWFARVDEADRR
jgi:heat shock protein HslJ